MTDQQIKNYLKNRGCAERVCTGGREYLVQRWKEFVEKVERGYLCGVEDYWNDLDTRELIHDIGKDSEVKDADERFRAMLTATEIKHWHDDRHSDYDFWNYGYPKNATGYFLEAIKQLILRTQISRKSDVR
jgi:CRISPR/Cas system Type II protein with McrA/HNH and RuvC-like nuclease domain